jgi:GTP pyrophosphokinase
MSTETSDGVATSRGVPDTGKSGQGDPGANAPAASPRGGGSGVASPPVAPSRRALLPRIFSRAQPSGAVDRLMKTVRVHHPKSDLALIERAYATAERAHSGQKRRSGEPYITHPVAVAQILADLGIGTKTLAAALLHDTVEDTDYTLDMLRRDFGDEVAMLVDGVTKLDKLKYGDSAQAETVRKMVVAMSKDIRVLVIKLADRLHNARTWGFVDEASATRKAQETLEIYAPLAHRLGIQAIKWELEDLSFSVLYPKLYVEIDSLVRQRTPQREEFVQLVIDAVNDDLKSAKIKGSVVGRPKQYYSIYQKMIVRGRDFDEIYDLVGIRVLVNSVRDCYAVLGSIHARWTPLPGRFKDYIATPKFNLYQSLHTTVIGPQGRAVEIQIRTPEMHQRAEFGVAAHWKYKERVNGGKSAEVASQVADTEMAWLAHITDWQAETSDPGEFLDNLRFEIGAKEVYVFTPQGKVIGLPAGATPVDFAYAVHTEVGHRTMGAKVNGRLVPLDSELSSGDSVEVLTSKNPDAAPSQDWLNFVKSPRARNKIRQWFKIERREEAIEQGKDLIARAMRKQNLPLQKLMNQDSLAVVAGLLRYDDVAALYAAVGEGHVSTQSVIEKVVASLQTEAEAEDSELVFTPRSRSSKELRHSDSGVLVRGAPDILVKLAKCCTPVPGDQIVGFVTRGAGVSVHRKDCHNVQSLLTEPERMIEVEWAPSSKSIFLVQIQVEALDRSGLLSDVTRVLSENHVNILSATVSTSSDRLALSRFVFEMGDTTHLDRVLNSVRRIDAVYDVYRVSSG